MMIDAPESATIVARAWYEHEGLRLAIAAISGGVGTRVIDNIFRWRSEGAAVKNAELDADAKASTQWRELYAEQSRRLERAEADCSAKIAALEKRVHDLELELQTRLQHTVLNA